VTAYGRPRTRAARSERDLMVDRERAQREASET
jgi:hypothetical protein